MSIRCCFEWRRGRVTERGKPTWMVIENLADRYAFAALALGMTDF